MSNACFDSEHDKIANPTLGLLADPFRRRRLSAALLTASERADPGHPSTISAWPAKQFPETIGGRPRSATLVITRHNGTPVAA